MPEFSSPSQTGILRSPAQEGSLLSPSSRRGFRDSGLGSENPVTRLPRMHPEVTPCSGVLTGYSSPGLSGPDLPAGPASHRPLPRLRIQQDKLTLCLHLECCLLQGSPTPSPASEKTRELPVLCFCRPCICHYICRLLYCCLPPKMTLEDRGQPFPSCGPQQGARTEERVNPHAWYEGDQACLHGRGIPRDPRYTGPSKAGLDTRGCGQCGPECAWTTGGGCEQGWRALGTTQACPQGCGGTHVLS